MACVPVLGSTVTALELEPIELCDSPSLWQPGHRPRRRRGAFRSSRWPQFGELENLQLSSLPVANTYDAVEVAQGHRERGPVRIREPQVPR
jgi:hypothetical protein